MAKISVRNLAAVSAATERRLKIAIQKTLRDPELRKEIGAIVIKDIKKNVTFGAAAKSTLKWRKRYDPLNKTDPAYSRPVIKGVFTGELFEDLKNNVKADTTKQQYVIEHSKKRHKKYQGVTKKIGGRSLYTDISKGLVKDLKYDYFKLTSAARNKIVKLVKEKIAKIAI